MEENKNDLLFRINETIDYIRNRTNKSPEVGIILGTGLGGLSKEINVESELSYENIPNFPVSTVEFHQGKLLFGTLSNKFVVAMQGRFHFYEGYSMQQITFPVRVMKYLGINTLLISNACGTMNPMFHKGDIMIIEDHINLLGGNPLIGLNYNSIGPRFPDMSEPYSHNLIALVERIALENKIKLQKGVYAAMTGPSLETRAEYKFLRLIGADVVGMSTVPEVIVARHMSLDVLGMSIITDECYPDSLKPVNIEDIIATANNAEPKLTLIFKELIRQL